MPTLSTTRCTPHHSFEPIQIRLKSHEKLVSSLEINQNALRAALFPPIKATSTTSITTCHIRAVITSVIPSFRFISHVLLLPPVLSTVLVSTVTSIRLLLRIEALRFLRDNTGSSRIQIIHSSRRGRRRWRRNRSTAVVRPVHRLRLLVHTVRRRSSHGRRRRRRKR